MPNIIEVKLKTVGKAYYFNSCGIEFCKGDGAIVETVRGVEYGTVQAPNRDIADSEVVGELKPALRKATEQDIEHHNSLLARKEPAMVQAKEKIRKHGLEMKLIDVDFTFDNSKVVFYFTAESRVDFRELVKDLASVFRMRIELRQVGIREEAKSLGGFGPCGRISCCNSFLNDFERVSIKMAKVQGLSLNPSKISGMCGRLMCCLKYENDHYAQTAKLMPKVGSEVTTPQGKGNVLSNDMLKLVVRVKMQTKDDSLQIEDFPLAQLKFTAPADKELQTKEKETDE